MTRTISTDYDPDGQVYAIVDSAGATYYDQYDADGHVIRSCMAPGDMPENGSIAWTPYSGTFSATNSIYTYTLNNSPDLGTTVIATVTSTTSNGSSLFHPYLELMSPSGVIVAVADSGTQYSATLMVPLDEASTATAYWQVIVTGSPRYAPSSGNYSYTLTVSGTTFTSLVNIKYKYDAAGNVTGTAETSTAGNDPGADD